MTDKRVVLVTCSSAKEARKIGRTMVEMRLAACANIVSAPVQSTYRWKGKIEEAREYLLVLKTTTRRFGQLREAVLKLHSYDLPEIIALPIVEGARAYLQWIDDCTTLAKSKKRGSKRARRTPL
ncbi:MAG TPA: divalent-cation tolerance protein CutA [Verrucomicrobiae bacterium]|nr:divalent-cation tolerance protein CutA [Verrucomicrobiae bacterium]